jgi:hypothetical protein
MRFWEYTLEELTGGKQPLGDQDGEILDCDYVIQSIVPITQNPRFATALVRGCTLADQALLELVDGKWTVAGSFIGDTILLAHGARKQGVAEELILRCAEHRQGLPFSTNFTEKGYSPLKRTHRLAIVCALRAKLPIPDRVLADYPDLQT